jgi:rhamnosyltransferase
MKIAAAVILYHPTKDAISNIKSYYDWVERIFVFDNSESQSEIKEDLLQLAKVTFHQDLKNEGIPKRLNEACRLALKQGYDWLLTMDQDSHFSPDVIRSYFNCFNNYNEPEKVAMFGPNRSRETSTGTNSCTTKEVNELITSGSLLNLALFSQIGNFDEALFIDLVDNEYCARAHMEGYKIIQFSDIYLVHELGKQVYHASIKSLFLIKKKKEVHSPLRCYYMYRNMLYIEKKFESSNTGFTKRLRKDVLARIKINLLYGRQRQEILKAIETAKEDFKNNKMGKKE